VKALTAPKVDEQKVGYFRFRQLGKKYVITNDTGHFARLTAAQFRKFIEGKLTSKEALHKELREKGFIRDYIDFDKTVEQVAKMGYEGVEFAGYYKYGRDAKGLHKLLDSLGLQAAATHVGFNTFGGSGGFSCSIVGFESEGKIQKRAHSEFVIAHLLQFSAHFAEKLRKCPVGAEPQPFLAHGFFRRPGIASCLLDVLFHHGRVKYHLTGRSVGVDKNAVHAVACDLFHDLDLVAAYFGISKA